ncbi:SDR family NAD(P)-dependent oxidoreductase [Ferrimonas balearica]|uniref:SDR family NAD(P)-dependent oxidoreductase n=1 Tax=Ferrimonas balearica TaxID=44012 RepID=UPI001C59F81E|nr:SDR family NAD(P)-dependent oxidoreductase [Ferrimonas balearica]MBY6105181.1 SDR family NAD(P)-dependent oxidoreductase [Ferrimonas balearica]MBY6225031.1 SDR family NAD(P)-dependent oxidoreductase [Ferrimonas balearica]
MIQFVDQVILVTGAARGLGRAYTLALAERGAHVVALDSGCDTDGEGRDPTVLEDVIELAHDMGAEVIGHCVDVRDPEALQQVVQDTLKRFGRIDGLVCNAGVLICQEELGTDLGLYRRHMDGNYFTTLASIQAVWPVMQAQGYGRIMVTSGFSALYGDDRMAGYAASNAANLALVRSLHVKANEAGIRINALCPACYSRLSKRWVLPEQADEMTPDTVVPAMLWLMSRRAPNGEVITAGGGHYALAGVQEGVGLRLEPAERRPETLASLWPNLKSSPKTQSYDSFAQRLARTMRSVIEGR